MQKVVGVTIILTNFGGPPGGRRRTPAKYPSKKNFWAAQHRKL